MVSFINFVPAFKRAVGPFPLDDLHTSIADEISTVTDYDPEYVYDRHSVRKKRDKKEIGISSVRGGTIVGEHDVIFAGDNEVVTISHQAQSRNLFAAGALNAAVFLADKGAGSYNMSDLLRSKY